jgi:hypothetical protein
MDANPSSRSGVPLLCAAGVFVIALVLYTWTLAPTVTLVDSGELIVAAANLGVAHPPGFPLYVVLAHAATWLPFGSVAERVNVLSAACGALAAALLVLVVNEMLRPSGRRQIVSRRPASKKSANADAGFETAPENPSTRRFAPAQEGPAQPERYRFQSPIAFPFALRSRPLLAASRRASVGDRRPPLTGQRTDAPQWMLNAVPLLVAALLLAFARTLWSYATIAEVYTLNAALILALFLLMLRWRRAMLAETERADGALLAAAFVFGLALGVHHVTVALTLPALAWLVYATAGARFFTSRRLLYAALCALAGLAIYAYLPIAAARDPVLNWGDPRTVQRLWWHVTGRQYQSYFSFSPGALWMQALVFGRRLVREFSPWWLPAALALAVIGLHAPFQRDRILFWFIVLVIVFNAAYPLTYAIAEDMDAYYLPTFMTAAVAAGVGAHVVLAAAAARAPRLALLAAAGSLLVPLVALAANFRFNDRSGYFIARDYAENIARAVEPGGTLLTLDWQVYAPLLYLRTIEGFRRDVTVIDVNLLRRSWYVDFLQRTYPRLMERCRDQVEPFLEDLHGWEQNPDLYRRDETLNRRLDDRFLDLLLAMVRNQLDTAPVYVTQDVALNRSPQDLRFAQSLAAAYQLVPQGLIFQLVSGRAFREPATIRLVTRGLADDTLRFEPDDVVRLKVSPVYVSMLYNRGRYFSLFGHHAEAVEAFRQALALDPRFAPAQTALAGSLNALRKAGQAPP